MAFNTCARISWVALSLTVSLATAAYGQQMDDPALAVETLDLYPLDPARSTVGFHFLGQDDFFFLEKDTGRVRRYDEGTVSTVLDLPVNSASERGLLGIDLHPNFATNGLVYLYYSRSSRSSDSNTRSEWGGNRLSSFRWDGNALTSESVLWSVPAAQPDGPNHNGGPVRFGPDGRLYLMTGDLNRGGAEQNVVSGNDPVSAVVGGIHRVTWSGLIPWDNPFYQASVPAAFRDLYAYGIRNSFGMAFDPVTGDLWDTENGPSVMDEINRVGPGFNSGWRTLMGPDSRDPQSASDLFDLLPGVSYYEDPVFSWSAPIGVTAIGFLAGSNLGPAYDDRVWVGQSNGVDLIEFRLNANRDGFVLGGGLSDQVADSGSEQASLYVGGPFIVVTDIQLDPLGDPRIMTIDGKIHRVTLEGVDSDNDGRIDAVDNCRDVPNPDQSDANASEDDNLSEPGIQHYGDACDADLDNDGIVAVQDFFSVFRPCFGAQPADEPSCAPADLNQDGIVSGADYFGFFRPALSTSPGPGITE